jgi:autotransporter translocation and assembly factor TamB
MSWRVDLENGDLALLPQLVPQVAGARGRIDLHGTLGGTPRHPDLKGSAAVRDGQMLISGRSELIEGLRADFRLEETRITMDSLFARSGRRGVVRADGVIDLEGGRLGHYAFHLAMDGFTAVEPGLYAAEFDAPRLMVTDGPRLNGQVLPHVEGDVTLRGARVLFDFANQSETQQLAARTQPLYWTYRIRLLANSNLRWQPPDGDIEFNADLTLQQTEKTLDIFGDLRSIRGTYDFLSNRFTVERADLTFDNVGGVNPMLDIEATTRVLPVFRGGGGGELPAGTGTAGKVHSITVRITDRAATPTIVFESDPGDWDQPTILSQLTVGRFLGGGTVVSQLSDPLDSYVTRMINAQLSPLLSRTFLRDVGQWRLQRQQGGLFGGRGDVFVTVAHQFNPRVQVSYSQRLPGFERPGVASLGAVGTVNSIEQGLLERNVAAEYRINRFFYITTELAQRRTQTTTALPTLVPEFNVNLKARWEY